MQKNVADCDRPAKHTDSMATHTRDKTGFGAASWAATRNIVIWSEIRSQTDAASDQEFASIRSLHHLTYRLPDAIDAVV